MARPERNPLALRVRRDLVIQPLATTGRRLWCVKDPLAQKHLQVREEELFILRRLDGCTTVEAITAAFEREFAPRRLGSGQLHSFLTMLHQEGLVLADAAGQGDELLRRSRSRRRQERLSTWMNPLAIRWRGVDPQGFLRWLYPRFRWLMSPWSLAAGLALAAFALGLCLLRIEELLARLPSASTLFHPGNVLWLAVALAVAKGLHELGHALVLQHFGGRCHELGIMLLVGTPCLYCDVSDAWLVPDKWRRAAIGVAGMYVELVLAAVATFLWWSSEPGLLNSLCLNLMLVCSFGTVLFNGNPLLRYDGYFILADLAEVPNLGQQASAVVQGAMSRWLLGRELPAARLAPRRGRWLLAAWWAASLVYRTMLLILILWLLVQAAEPHGWAPAARMFAAFVVAGMVLPWGWRLLAFVRRPDWRRRVSIRRLLVRGGLLTAALALVGLVPLPYSLHAPTVLAPVDARTVYVTMAGRLLPADDVQLDETAEPDDTAQPDGIAGPDAGRLPIPVGARVVANQPLARLVSPELAREVAALEGERGRLRERVAALEGRRGHDAVAGNELPAARQALADAEERLAQRQQDQKRLTLRAPIAGTVLPPPARALSVESDDLNGWSGTPLEERNLGCFLATGEAFCLVGDPEHLEATLIVEPSEIEFVRPGQTVQLRIDQLPGEVFSGRVSQIAQIDLEIAPRDLPADAEIALRTDTAGERRLVEHSYQVRVALDPHEHALLANASGEAKISVASQSLGLRLARFLQATFRFRT